MGSTEFFWITIGICVFMLIVFSFGKGGVVPPSKLDLSKAKFKAPTKSPAVHQEKPSIPDSPEAITLNVFFNYNGHTWDAYEVLGLPAGAKMPQVEAAMKEHMAKISAESKPFYQAAFRAIEQKLKFSST